MLRNKMIAALLAMSFSSLPSTTNTVEKSQQKLDASIFNPIITEFTQKFIEEYKRHNPEFPKYDLSEDQLIQIARLCQQEQGSVEGVAAEASLMANRYEINHLGEYYEENADEFKYYIENCGWFEGASYYMNNGDCSKEALEIARQVLVKGKRTIPKYVDEHCCIANVSINTGNSENKEDYIPFVTQVKDDFGGNFKFYGFPGTSDPFGYTSEANREKYGDVHYEFEKLLTQQIGGK